MQQRGETGPARSDTALLSAHLAGDRSAFAELFDRHHRWLFAGVFGVLGQHQDTEDALQDAFTRAVRHAGTFRGEAPVTAWLWRIAINSAIQQLTRRRRLATPVDLAEMEEEAPTPTRPMFSGEPATTAQVDERLALEAALQGLPFSLREVFVLCVLRDFTQREVAERAGIPQHRVKSRLHKARRRLAETLGPNGRDEAR